uniref:F-box domain-containing protein n=1 Tax=Periophthalmus magnuspinnatus TaxID=409849 RepID=A0A3B4AXD3_9GOBI
MDGTHNDEDEISPELPIEIMVYILSLLKASDRKEASLVCRSWYYASQDMRFQNVTFSFPASASSLELIRSLSRKPRCSLIISQVGLSLGPKVESLALPGSSITEASLLALLPRLTSLRRLDLRGLDSLFMSGAFLSREEHRQQVRTALSGLQELDLSDLRYLSDLTFNRLTSCTTLLRRLSMAGCHIAFEFDPYRGCPVGVVEDSSALLSLRNLRKLLTEQKSTLVALDLSRTAITPESLRTIAQVPGLVLEELRLQGCKELTDYSVEVLVKHQPELQTLDISGCTELTSRSVTAIAHGLKSLRHLSLSRDWRVTEKGLADLLSLPSLKSLDLSECLNISGVETVNGLISCNTTRAQLQILNLKSCTYMRDLAVFSLVQLFGETLRELDLTSCTNVTDLSVHALPTFSPRLKVLRLGWCKEVTDFGLLGMMKLPFEERPKQVTQTTLEHLKHQPGSSLITLSRLEELDLSACPKLTDSSITQVLQYPDLQRLSLSMLPEISDASLVSVACHCRSLTHLDLSECPQISDRGVAKAAPFLHRLQHLSLSCCNNITDRSMSILAQHCKRLKTLDISRCKNISATTVEKIQTLLPFLENIHCKFIGGTEFTPSL